MHCLMSLGDGKLYMMNTVQIVNQSLYKIEHIAKQLLIHNKILNHLVNLNHDERTHGSFSNIPS